MKLKFLSLNDRGTNDRNKMKIIKAVIRSQRVDLVCLHEIKIQDVLGISAQSWSGKFLRLGSSECKGGNSWGGSYLHCSL